MKLYVIRGLPGSGKSTLAREMLFSGMVDAHFEADMFHVGSDGVYNFDPAKAGEAHKWCQSQTYESLLRHQNTAVSNTFTMKWEFEPYLKIAQAANAQVCVIVCTGQFDNLHNVPADVLSKMRERWEP